MKKMERSNPLHFFLLTFLKFYDIIKKNNWENYMNSFNTKYKDKKPEETINNIQNFF